MKMKAKGLDIALVRLLTVCCLTCNIFMFVYKSSGWIFGRVAAFLHLRVVKRKGYHEVIAQGIRFLFTSVSVRRSVYVISGSVLLSVGIKGEP